MSSNPSEYTRTTIGESDAEIVQRGVYFDERGVFQKPFISDFFTLTDKFLQLREVNVSQSHKAGTVRGFHMQSNLNAETKIITCISGEILDVIIDCRQESSTYGHIYTIKLSVNDGKSVIIPKGYAHGFQTLTDNATVLYCVDSSYAPKAQVGINPLSEGCKNIWPLEISEISQQDMNMPTWEQVMNCDAELK